MRACQHGKHFRPHLLEGIALERLRLFLLTVLPAFVAGCMKELMQFGGIVFIRAAESVRIGQRHFVFLVAEKGIAAVMFDDNAGTGDEAFHQLVSFDFRHGVRGLFLGGEAFDLGGIEHRKGIEKRPAFHVGHNSPLRPEFLNTAKFFPAKKFPAPVFLYDVGNLFRAQNLDAMLSLANIHLQFGMSFLKGLELSEGHPAVIGIASGNTGQQQTHHVCAAVFPAGHRTEGHPHRRVGSPPLLPFTGLFRQREHGFGNAVDELLLNFAADLKAIFPFFCRAHWSASLMSIMTQSCISCGLRKPAATASSRDSRKAPASSWRSISSREKSTHSFSAERREASKSPRLLR